MRKNLISILAISAFTVGIMTYSVNTKSQSISPEQERNKVTIEKVDKDIVLINDLEKQNSNGKAIKNKKLNSKTAFESNSNIYKQERVVVSDDNLQVELDKQGDLITYTNKEKIKAEKLNAKNDNKTVQNKNGLKAENLSAKNDDKAVQDKNEFKKVAKKILKEFDVNFSEKEKYMTEFENGYIDVTFPRSYEGYSFDRDFIKIVLEPSTGEVVTISKRYTSEVPQINIKVSEEEAKKSAINLLKKEDIVSTELIIVNPNEQWLDKVISSTSTITRLAYAITFSNNDVVWVDAEDASVLGGKKVK